MGKQGQTVNKHRSLQKDRNTRQKAETAKKQ